MCGGKCPHSYMDECYLSTVSFGDCSTPNVIGKGDISIITKK